MEGTNIEWIEASSYEEMSRLGAQLLVAQLKQKPNSVLGFATGGTPKGLYQDLIRLYEAGDVSFANAIGFNLDEYVGITKENKHSYHTYMEENLYKYINLPKENRFIPEGDTKDLQGACQQYDTLIAQYGGIDILLLGIGVNGHIGFNEPGSAFTANTNIVELAKSTVEANKRFFDKNEEVPCKAITMGIGSILKAKKILLLMSGSSKQQAYERLRSGEVTEEFPASALHMHHNVTVIYTGVK